MDLLTIKLLYTLKKENPKEVDLLLLNDDLLRSLSDDDLGELLETIIFVDVINRTVRPDAKPWTRKELKCFVKEQLEPICEKKESITGSRGYSLDIADVTIDIFLRSRRGDTTLFLNIYNSYNGNGINKYLFYNDAATDFQWEEPVSP